MNKLTLNVAIFVAIFSVFYLGEVNSQSARGCRAIVSDLNKRNIQEISRCTKQLQFTSTREKIEKSNCIMKCVLTNQNILSPDGKFSQENIDAFVDREFPGESAALIKKQISPCLEKFAYNLDTSDEYCKSYEPVIKCVTSKLPTLCG